MDKSKLIETLADEFIAEVRAYDAAPAGDRREDMALAVQGSINRVALIMGITEELDQVIAAKMGVIGYGPFLSYDLAELS